MLSIPIITWSQFWLFDAYAAVWFAVTCHFAAFDTDTQQVQDHSLKLTSEANALVDAGLLLIMLGFHIRITVIACIMLIVVSADMLSSIKTQIKLVRHTYWKKGMN